MPNPKKSSASKSIVKKPSPELLTIPLELREHIFAELLSDDPSSLFQLVLTNQQLMREARPFLFKQSLVFDGQFELYEWLHCVNRDFIRYVTDIQFKLYDIDPEKIVGALGMRLRQANLTAASSIEAPMGNPYEQACDFEIERLGKAFSLFRNVRHFTILASTDADPRPPYRMLVAFSQLLSIRFPHLHSLTIQEEFLPLTFISNMHDLRYICFTGMSTTPPADVTALFSGLSCLDSLEINRLDTKPSPRQAELYHKIAISQQCDYVRLMRSIPGLESLAFYGEICEDEEDDEATPEQTNEFLFALDGRGCPLDTLKIFANVNTPDEGWVRRRLASFATSSLVHFETFHDHFPGFNCLPKTLETLVLWSSERQIDIGSAMKDLVIKVKEHRATIPELAEIIIYLDVENWNELEKARMSIQQRIALLDIHLRWRRWDGEAPRR